MAANEITVVTKAGAFDPELDAPEYAHFKVNPAFLGRVQSMVALCGAQGLTEVRYEGGPIWGPPGYRERVLLASGSVVVTCKGTFWFTDRPKKYDYEIATRPLSIADLLQVFELSNEGDVIPMGMVLAEIEGAMAELLGVEAPEVLEVVGVDG